MSHETPLIRMPELSPALSQVWHLLFDLSEVRPDTWCLIGGLMVMLHGLECGRSDARPTADGDVLVDIRSGPALFERSLRSCPPRVLCQSSHPRACSIASSAKAVMAN
jgi:hypothetical protein